jgi:hypothetical protein
MIPHTEAKACLTNRKRVPPCRISPITTFDFCFLISCNNVDGVELHNVICSSYACSETFGVESMLLPVVVIFDR